MHYYLSLYKTLWFHNEGLPMSIEELVMLSPSWFNIRYLQYQALSPVELTERVLSEEVTSAPVVLPYLSLSSTSYVIPTLLA